MSQKLLIPKIEDIVWAELLAEPSIKRRARNSTVLDKFLTQGWIKHTSRRDEFAITETGRAIANKRLASNWPEWKQELFQFKAAQLSPEDAAAWPLFRRSKTLHQAREVKNINRRTLAAWERRHSKVPGDSISEAFLNTQVTIDEVVRLRLPPKSTLVLKNGETVACDWQMQVYGEINIPERGWKHIEKIEAPQSKAIISIENKGAFVDFPPNDAITLVFVPGDNISALRRVMAVITKQPLLHFGDLDPKGIEIYRTLAREFTVQHFIPRYACEYVDTHARACESPWAKGEYSSFDEPVAELVSGNHWLEQEALVLDHRFEAEVARAIERVGCCAINRHSSP